MVSEYGKQPGVSFVCWKLRMWRLAVLFLHAARAASRKDQLQNGFDGTVQFGIPVSGLRIVSEEPFAAGVVFLAFLHP